MPGRMPQAPVFSLSAPDGRPSQVTRTSGTEASQAAKRGVGGVGVAHTHDNDRCLLRTGRLYSTTLQPSLHGTRTAIQGDLHYCLHFTAEGIQPGIRMLGSEPKRACSPSVRSLCCHAEHSLDKSGQIKEGTCQMERKTLQ